MVILTHMVILTKPARTRAFRARLAESSTDKEVLDEIRALPLHHPVRLAEDVITLVVRVAAERCETSPSGHCGRR